MVRKSFQMRAPRNRTFSIHGAMLDVDVTHDEFLKELVNWIGSKGWSFIGMTDEVAEEEASNQLIDLLCDKKDQNE
ncbi:hypothetical protein ACRS52_20285 [Bacillus cytotoxicus]|nr:hypothetical protein [Bacillus cytotoxicus]QTR82953.1 hypothetical protein JC777_21175 [Bacillus cytotoxicus]QTR86691.1 hypothetical protein JC774_19680 [Bacillus cytotoxicus]